MKKLFDKPAGRVGFGFIFVGGVMVVARYLMGGRIESFGLVIFFFGLGLLLVSLIKR